MYGKCTAGHSSVKLANSSSKRCALNTSHVKDVPTTWSAPSHRCGRVKYWYPAKGANRLNPLPPTLCHKGAKETKVFVYVVYTSTHTHTNKGSISPVRRNHLFQSQVQFPNSLFPLHDSLSHTHTHTHTYVFTWYIRTYYKIVKNGYMPLPRS